MRPNAQSILSSGAHSALGSSKPDHKKLGGRKKGTPSLISRAVFAA
jgi:hypothetical protein